jgi:hypothetical protein
LNLFASLSSIKPHPVKVRVLVFSALPLLEERDLKIKWFEPN